ncbi:FAD-dependent oxidoreductase [Leptothoe spongobia]|uniref:FAD-dependent monooxygenase n=1 Tax=Leptothoe spongobia TAU-MAC 1115 TaxID=1967444 RepID=A0A947DE29_9CYAN|nr:NAD(P)/FAD-dependent oxidoreductase [Leptothoe spongobia]MBT9315287.1 FAD-dependent monooxygenase [Leptothoe spongobia TAU-MAC 1115]
MTNPSQKIVIIGAGPAGLLLAHYLLCRQQYHIEIYDRRPDPRQASLNEQRSFPISLQKRGRKALQAIPGLEDAIAQQAIVCQGTVIHSKTKARDIPRDNPTLTIDRSRLVLTLINQLTNTYPDTVLKLKFDCACQHINAANQTVSLQTATGQTFSTSYDRLIGADGARSQVRTELVAHHGLTCNQTYVPDAYKSIFLARTNADQNIELAPDRIHTSNIGRNNRIVLAPQPNGQLHGAFIFNAENNPLEEFTTKEEILTYFEEKLPVFRQLMNDTEADELLHRPVARLVTVKCDRFHQGDHILLIGDAAHAVSPSIGQGCNSSLEDIQLINQLLDQFQDDWSQVLPQFSQQRVPEAHALKDLSDYSFPRSTPLIIEFFLRLTLGRKLHQWFPQWFQPFVFDLVLDSDLSYAEVLNLSQGWINKVKRSMAS